MSALCRLLLIDDSPDDRANLRQMLLRGSNRRYQFSEAETGGQALDRVREQQSADPLQPPFDCVLLDLRLPDMTGHEWLASFSQDGELPPCPVVVITGWAGADHQAGPRLLRAGAQDYIGKSWSTAESLTRAVDNAIERYGLLVSQKTAQVRLRASERRYRSLFDAIEECLCVLERISPVDDAAPDFRCVDVNPAFIAQIDASGMPGGIGTTLRQLPPDAAEHWIGVCDLVHSTGVPLSFEHCVAASPRVLSACAFRMGEPGQHKVAIAFSDISERKAAEARLRQQALALADLDRRKDEFLALLSHELRNPLAALTSASVLLRLRPDDAALQRKARAIVERQVGQLTHLVDDLLEVSRIATGQVQLRRQTIDVGSIVARAVETTQQIVAVRKHTLTVDLPPQPVWLHADAARLEQLLVNLLNNAAKYTDEGGRIEVHVQREADRALLRVRDNGIGMSAELLPRIFDLFTQADRSLDRAQGGLGIGLSLVQHLVQLHGGSVEVSSELGQGSEFRVRLPAVDGPEAAHGDAPSAPRLATVNSIDAAAGLQSTTPARRVLVVDDNIDAADILATLLMSSGHDARVAHDGLAALELAKDFWPDVVLLDIGLPELDGHEVARRLRLIAGLEHLVLVAITGYGQSADRLLAQRAGFDHHLVKPADLAQVLEIVQAARRPVTA